MADMLSAGIVAQFPDSFEVRLPDTSTEGRAPENVASIVLISSGALLLALAYLLNRRPAFARRPIDR